MRGVVDAAVRRDADDIAQRCRSMVERSARYAIALLIKLEEEPTTEPERRVVRRKRVLVPSGLKRSSSEVSQDR